MVIGTRCQLSEEAKRRGLKTYRWRHGKPLEYVGTVIGESGECWLVLWDGLKYSRPLEKVLIAPMAGVTTPEGRNQRRHQ